jgi:hypothetical protein
VRIACILTAIYDETIVEALSPNEISFTLTAALPAQCLRVKSRGVSAVRVQETASRVRLAFAAACPAAELFRSLVIAFTRQPGSASP